MGKTSKWIKNLLLGKNEDNRKTKKKKNFLSNIPNNTHNQEQIVPPKMKFKIWSFGKHGAKKGDHDHKVSKSVGSLIDNDELLKKADHDRDQARARKMAIKSRRAQVSAAINIQSAFRAYLARKALNALKGLVKIQAAVRGHLVRKQIAATLRRMHALMAIQVRARFHRIQINNLARPLPQTSNRSTYAPRKSRSFPDQHQFSGEGSTEMKQKGKPNQTMKTKKKKKNGSQIEERIEHEITTYYSKISKQKHDHNYHKNFSPTTSSDPNSPLIHNHQKTRRTKLQNPYSKCPSFANLADYLDIPILDDFPFLPNYMSETKSSRAKFRSNSEPKQRPGLNMKQKSKDVEEEEYGYYVNHRQPCFIIPSKDNKNCWGSTSYSDRCKSIN